MKSDSGKELKAQNPFSKQEKQSSGFKNQKISEITKIQSSSEIKKTTSSNLTSEKKLTKTSNTKPLISTQGANQIKSKPNLVSNIIQRTTTHNNLNNAPVNLKLIS